MTDTRHLAAILAATICFSQPAWTQQSATSDAARAWGFYKQQQYGAAAAAFEKVIKVSPTPTNCYYAALSNRASHKELRAQQLFQYIVSTFPSSREAALSKQQLSTMQATNAASASGSSADDLPESVRRLMPPEMQKLLETADGKKALQQVLHDKADQIATIRKAEQTGALNPESVASQAQSEGMFAPHADAGTNDHPFTARDIAKLGAHGIDQTRFPNCWFESSLAALAELPRGQRLIASMIRTKGKDAYVVRFPGDGNEYVITALDLARNSMHDAALWASLIDCAETRKFPNNQGASGSYGDQSRLEVGLGCITGCKAEIIYPAQCSVQEISSFIGGAVSSQNPVVCGTYASFGGAIPLVVPLHAYTITGLDTAKNMIILRNPHGMHSQQFVLPDDPNHQKFEQLSDGVIHMSIPLFQKYFYSVARSFI